MLERGLKAIQPKTYVPRTSDGRADKPSPNLLLGQALPEKPNQVRAGDITFIPTTAGWIYLAVVIDLCSRKIVGWALAEPGRLPKGFTNNSCACSSSQRNGRIETPDGARPNTAVTRVRGMDEISA